MNATEKSQTIEMLPVLINSEYVYTPSFGGEVKSFDQKMHRSDAEGKQDINTSPIHKEGIGVEPDTVTPSEQKIDPPANLPKTPVMKKLVPDRPMSFSFDNELKWIDRCIEIIRTKKEKEIESLSDKYSVRLRLIFDRFVFVNKHNKKDVCLFALRYGQLLNEIEVRFKRKHQFTNWRAKVFSNVSERYVQKWQQAARVGKIVEHFSAFGLDTAIELKYLVESKEKEFPHVTDEQIIEVMQGFIILGGHSTDRNLFRTAMDAAITHFRLQNAIDIANIPDLGKILLKTRPQILESVKIKGGALEKGDAEKIIDIIKDLSSEDERFRIINEYVMDKCVPPKNVKANEPKKNLKGANMAITLFNTLFDQREIHELDLDKDQVIKAFNNLVKYFNNKSIEIPAIIAKEA